jgi:glycosyltransferase involved in cell wall biosynthesis
MVKRTTIFIDISPLLDYSWTGIAVVTKNLAQYFIECAYHRVIFFSGTHSIDPDYVSIALRQSPGGFLHTLVRAGFAKLKTVAEELSESSFSFGIFTNTKPFHNVFDHETSIVHDLSPLLMPEMHEDWAVRAYCEGLLLDTASSNLVCCVSAATRDDVITYLPVLKDKTYVNYPGSDWSVAEAALLPSVRPYILILGTVEPRKNLELIAQFLLSYPEICAKFVFVFVGRSGWGEGFRSIFGNVLIDPRLQNSVLLTGFLPEVEKRRLAMGAVCAIYSSLFEGFGLPVLECMAVGCPILLSRSSSLMEFELPQALYFDPFSIDELHESFVYVTTMSDLQRAELSAELRLRSKPFTWQAFGDRLMAKLVGDTDVLLDTIASTLPYHPLDGPSPGVDLGWGHVNSWSRDEPDRGVVVAMVSRDAVAAHVGYIETIDQDHCVRGWYKLRNRDDVRLTVEYQHNGIVAAQVEASLYRGDVANAGHGDGCYGFCLPLPLIIFDGAFHEIALHLRHAGDLLPEVPTFGAIMPKLPYRSNGITAHESRRLRKELLPPPASEQAAQPLFRRQLAIIVNDLSDRFGPAVAIDLLYAFALERPADADGLLDKVESLHAGLSTIEDVVTQVLEAPEFATRSGNAYFAPLSVLECWVDTGPRIVSR